MASQGDVVLADFAGAVHTKRRPLVVLSSDDCHRQRPDLILGVLTTNVAAATTDSGYVLLDWVTAGLKLPTAFRSYLGMVHPSSVRVIGHLSDRDWYGVQQALRKALI